MQTVSRPRLSRKVAAKPSEGASVSKNKNIRNGSYKKAVPEYGEGVNR